MYGRRLGFVAGLLVTLATTSFAFAASKAAPNQDPFPAALGGLTASLQKFKLDNGLRVVLQPRPDTATVAVSVTYAVGSRNERTDQSGFAHLFEHMMFQGSRNVPKGEHFTLVSARGGELNGTTSADRTNYFEALPSSELPLALWLEADRMRWLAVTQENFENQRQVVQEEFRMRVTNAPYRPALITLQEQVFQGYWPYEHPTIGTMQTLDAAKLEWVQDFHTRYYAPNNAVLTIVGNFDADDAAKLVHQYFDAIPAQPAVPALALPALPAARTRELVQEVTDNNAKTPAVLMGWRIPPALTPEHYALELATVILTDGDSSVLHDSLVRQHSWAQDVSAWTHDFQGPDLLAIMAVLTSDAPEAKVTALIDRQLQRLAKEGPTAAELDKARHRLESFLLFDLQSNLSQSTQLGEFEAIHGDARLLGRRLESYFTVSREAVRDAVSRYLTPEARVRLLVRPVPSPSAPPPAAAPPRSKSSQPATTTQSTQGAKP